MPKYSASKILADKFYRLIKTHLGFDFEKASHQNMRQLKAFIKESRKHIYLTAIKSDGNKCKQFTSYLTEAEIIIFNSIINHITLKHATNDVTSILDAGKMLALKEREKNETIATNRHTRAKDGSDQSLYFVAGIGNHQTPLFLENATHVITIELNQLLQEDSTVANRLWISNHSDEYINETLHQIKIGNATFSMQYHNNDKKKSYTILFDDETRLQWQIDYHQEIFTKNEVLPGIALQFIVRLRQLNYKNNPVIENLYQLALSHASEFIPHLEQILTYLMPGTMQLEAKIINHLDLKSKFIAVTQTPEQLINQPMMHQINYAFLNNDPDYFRKILTTQKKRLDPESIMKNIILGNGNKYQHFFDTLHGIRSHEYVEISADQQKEFFQIILNTGFALRETHTIFQTVLHKAFEEHNYDLLFLMLMRAVANQTVHKLSSLLDPNCRNRHNEDLIELACEKIYNRDFFEILYMCGANFQKRLPHYLNIALGVEMNQPIGDRKTNHAALDFFCYLPELSLKDIQAYNKTPLMYAVIKQELNAVRLLVEKLQADINAPFLEYSLGLIKQIQSEDNGKTALHFAAETQNQEIIQYLLSHGANPNLRSSTGLTALNCVNDKESEAYQILKQVTTTTPTDAQRKKAEEHLKKIKNHEAELTEVIILLTGVDKKNNRYVILGKNKGSCQGILSAPELKSNSLNLINGRLDHDDGSIIDGALRIVKESISAELTSINTCDCKILGAFEINEYNHENNIAILIDVNRYNLKPKATGSFIFVKKIFLNDINTDSSKPTAHYLTHNDQTILGSDALLISYVLINNTTGLDIDQKKKIQKQLNIEHHGIELIIKILDKYSHDEDGLVLSPYTFSAYNQNHKDWNKFQHLLENNALAASSIGKHTVGDIILKLVALNSTEGLDLLLQYGIDIDHPGIITYQKRENSLTALAYCAIVDNVEMAKYFIKNGADINNFANRRRLLLHAIEQNNKEIYDYFLSIGVKPNKYQANPKSLVNEWRNPAILCNLIAQQRSSDLLYNVVERGDIFLTADRRKKTLKNALTVAISENDKHTARKLLATMRFPLMQKDKKNNSAIDYLRKKDEWDDILTICDFISKYRNMNSYLQSIGITQMDSFSCTTDAYDNKLIHFVSQTKNCLQTLQKILQSGLDYSQDSKTEYYGFFTANEYLQYLPITSTCLLTTKGNDYSYYSIALNQTMLASLLESEIIAEFFFTDAFHSPFFKATHNIISEQLQQQILYGEPASLNNKELYLPNYEICEVEARYYKQLIKESLTLKEVTISFDKEQFNSALFLTEAAANNLRIVELNLNYSSINPKKDKKMIDSCSMLIKSLPKLKAINLRSPLNHCLQILQICELVTTNHLVITIHDLDDESARKLLEKLPEMNTHHRIKLNPDPENLNEKIYNATLCSKVKFFAKQSTSQPNFERALKELKNHKILELNNDYYSNATILSHVAKNKFHPTTLNIKNCKPSYIDVAAFKGILRTKMITEIATSAEMLPLLIEEGDLENITKFSLGYTSSTKIIQNIGLQLSEIISMTTKLELLDLSRLPKNNLECIIDSILPSICKAPNLKYLSLEGFFDLFPETIANKIYQTLAKSSSLLGIDIKEPDISNHNYQAMMSRFKKNLYAANISKQEEPKEDPSMMQCQNSPKFLI